MLLACGKLAFKELVSPYPGYVSSARLFHIVSKPSFFNGDSTLSFSNRFYNSTNYNHERGILEIIPKMQIHIPMMEVVKEEPLYEKYFKEPFISMDNLKENK